HRTHPSVAPGSAARCTAVLIRIGKTPAVWQTRTGASARRSKPVATGRVSTVSVARAGAEMVTSNAPPGVATTTSNLPFWVGAITPAGLTPAVAGVTSGIRSAA